MLDLTDLTNAELSAKMDSLAQLRNAAIRASEGHDHGQIEYAINAVAAEMVSRKRTADAAAFRAEWTRDVFEARRAAYNAEVSKLPRTSKGIAWTDLRTVEGKLGYGRDALLKAKEIWG